MTRLEFWGIYLAISRMDKLIATEIFQVPDEDARVIFQRSVIIEMLCSMTDLMKHYGKAGHRVIFADDIPTDLPGVKDITDLIHKFRNAICHIDSNDRYLDKEDELLFFMGNAETRTNRIYWGNKEIGYKSVGHDYTNETAFFMGKYVLLYERHILRAYQELKAFFGPTLTKLMPTLGQVHRE